MPTKPWLRRFIKADPYLLLLLCLSLFAVTPLFAPGYFYGAHDGRHSVFYLIMFDASVQDGALWPRWAMHHNQGYGYPTFLIQAPLGFYLAELFVLLGAGYTLAAKLTWSVGALVSGWGIYTLTVHWLRREPYPVVMRAPSLDPIRLAGVVAGLIYVFIPYHLVDRYVRAALNDALLLAWFPWVFLAFDRLLEAGAAPGWQRRLALAILALAGVLLTHTFALISFAPLLVTYVIFCLVWRWSQQPRAGWAVLQRVGLAAAGGIGALLVCATFLIPLFVEGQSLQQSVYVSNTYDFRRHFVHFGQYFSPFWGFGYSDDPSGGNDGMSFQVGLIALLLGIVALYVLKRQGGPRGQLIYLIGASIGLLLIMTPLAAPAWEALPALTVIQFPWRLLALTAFTLSALGGLVVWKLWAMGGSSAEGILVIGLLALLGSAPYLRAELQPVEPWREDGRAIAQFESEHPDMLGYTTWVQEPFQESPMTADYAAESYQEEKGYTDDLTRLAIIGGSGEVVSNYSRGSSFGGVVQLDEPATVRIHLYHFPGWQVRVDGVLTPHRISEPHGLIEVDAASGTHRIDVRMGSTPPRQLGTAISWATLILVLGLAAWGGRKGQIK